MASSRWSRYLACESALVGKGIIEKRKPKPKRKSNSPHAPKLTEMKEQMLNPPKVELIAQDVYDEALKLNMNELKEGVKSSSPHPYFSIFLRMVLGELSGYSVPVPLHYAVKIRDVHGIFVDDEGDWRLSLKVTVTNTFDSSLGRLSRTPRCAYKQADWNIVTACSSFLSLTDISGVDVERIDNYILVHIKLSVLEDETLRRKLRDAMSLGDRTRMGLYSFRHCSDLPVTVRDAFAIAFITPPLHNPWAKSEVGPHGGSIAAYIYRPQSKAEMEEEKAKRQLELMKQFKF